MRVREPDILTSPDDFPGKDAVMTILDRITTNPKQCEGRPCIRGMRIRVADVLDLFAAGLSADEILTELPDLEPADLIACFHYAARRVEHPILQAA